MQDGIEISYRESGFYTVKYSGRIIGQISMDDNNSTWSAYFLSGNRAGRGLTTKKIAAEYLLNNMLTNKITSTE